MDIFNRMLLILVRKTYPKVIRLYTNDESFICLNTDENKRDLSLSGMEPMSYQ